MSGFTGLRGFSYRSGGAALCFTQGAVPLGFGRADINVSLVGPFGDETNGALRSTAFQRPPRSAGRRL